MENKIIYSKTARGVREAASKTKEVSRELRKVLKAVDGKSNFQALLAALDGYTEKTLRQAITYLIANGYLRDPDEYGELSASSGGLPALVSHDDDELDFTSIADTPSEPIVVATDEIEAKAKARAKQEAEALKQRKAEEERLRREAEAQVKQEAEALARRKAEEAQAAQAAEEKIRLEKQRQAEERLQREAEARATQEAEALKQRKAEEERMQKEAEARMRREAEAKVKQEAEARAKQEAEALKQRKAEEERLRREAELKVKQEAEALARRKAEEAQAAEEKIRLEKQRQVEERLQREAEAKAAEEAAERLRREAWAKSRQEAEALKQRKAEEERMQKEAEERLRREAEVKVKQEAEARAKQEAEALKQRKAEEERMQKEAEERMRREAEAKVKQEAEAEALARRKAEEAQAAQAAEEKIRLEKQRQAEERLQREAEARATQEAEALKQRKAEEERMQKEAEARLRREAEAKEREEGQKLAEQDASGYADEMVDRFAVSVPVVEMPPRQTKAAWQARIASKLASMGNISTGQSRGRTQGRRRFVRAAVFALVAGVAVLHVISFDERLSALEKTATAQFKQPVKAKDLHFWLLPTPHWRLQDVIIGDQGQIRIALVKAKTSIIGALFNSRDAITLIDAELATLNAEGVSWVLAGKAQANILGFPRIDVKGVQVRAPFGALPTFDVNALMDANGNWQKIELRVPGQKFSADLNATDEGARVTLSAAAYILPLSLDSVNSSKPATLTLNNFSAVGMLANKEFLASEFSGEINGGYVSGKARLNWRSGWMLNGEVRARLLDTAAMFPALSGGGVLSGSGTFAMQAADPAVLMESARAEGNFLVERGVLYGIDLSQVLRGLGSGGRTPYATLDGTFSYDKGKTQLRNVKIIDGIMTAKGNVDITADKIMSGRFAVELKSNFINLRGAVPVAGTLDTPQFGR